MMGCSCVMALFRATGVVYVAVHAIALLRHLMVPQ